MTTLMATMTNYKGQGCSEKGHVVAAWPTAARMNWSQKVYTRRAPQKYSVQEHACPRNGKLVVEPGEPGQRRQGRALCGVAKVPRVGEATREL